MRQVLVNLIAAFYNKWKSQSTRRHTWFVQEDFGKTNSAVKAWDWGCTSEASMLQLVFLFFDLFRDFPRCQSRCNPADTGQVLFFVSDWWRHNRLWKTTQWFTLFHIAFKDHACSEFILTENNYIIIMVRRLEDHQENKTVLFRSRCVDHPVFPYYLRIVRMSNGRAGPQGKKKMESRLWVQRQVQKILKYTFKRWLMQRRKKRATGGTGWVQLR